MCCLNLVWRKLYACIHLLAGRAASCEHLRLPPLRGNGDHLKKLTRLAMRVKSSEDLDSGDVYFYFDAGKAGNKTVLISGFLTSDLAALSKQVRSIFLVSSEDSIKDRMSKVRGFNAANQVETMHIVTK